MPFTSHIYELIDKFLNGELSGDELLAFEKRMHEDQKLWKEIQKQKTLRKSLFHYETRKSLKSRLDKIQSEIDAHELKEQLSHSSVFYKKFLTRNILINSSVAASIAAIVTFATLLLSGFFSFNHHVADYMQLRNDIKNISSRQNSLWKAFSSMEDKRKPLIPTGTCFAIASDGYFVTNYHVIKGADSAYITQRSDSDIKYRVKVVYEDTRNDLAILKVDDPKFKPLGLIPYTLKKNLSELGEYVYTLGYSKQDVVFNEGSVSSLSGFNEDSVSYQISVPVNPGNSGGPVISAEGELIGMVSAKNFRVEGATFAIKSGYILSSMDSVTSIPDNPRPRLPIINMLRGKKRTEQVKSIQPFIFKVEVYQ